MIIGVLHGDMSSPSNMGRSCRSGGTVAVRRVVGTGSRSVVAASWATPPSVSTARGESSVGSSCRRSYAAGETLLNRRVVRFFALAFALTWVWWLPMLARPDSLMATAALHRQPRTDAGRLHPYRS